MIKQHVEAYMRKHSVESIQFGTERLNSVIDELSSKVNMSVQTSQSYWKQGEFLTGNYLQLKNELLKLSIARNN